MSSLLTRTLCLFALLGAAHIADAQVARASDAGDAGANAYGAGSTMSNQRAGAEMQGGGAAGGVYANPNAPQPLPPLTQTNANYDAAVNMVTPLTPDQIRALRKRIDAAKRAASTNPTRPPKPVYSVQTVDLSPGAPPPIVRVSDLGSAVTFIDSAGAPWDIAEVDNMAKGRFEVLRPVPGVPTITITADGSYVEGDVAVFLKGLPFPVVVKMIAGQRETDYRQDIRIPRRGPNTVEAAHGTPAIDLPGDSMQSILDGTDTPGARPIHIENGPPGMTAWALGDHIVLRTNLFLSDPAYYGAVTGADGTHVYDIPKTPVVTVSDNGISRNIILDLE
ncbi:MAG: DotH/IcmK family type IV secretion protein [Paraburkholderia sp.]|uniref:DotH/IcmK family type IV secretion protein n=2 Tax=Burkholderiales TaxID=80840 RepID=UPI0014854CC5|nr:DotH/IcmK family type IV secretion protein [Burkholderia sp. 4M9327F10]